MNQKGFANVVLIITIIVIIAGGVGYWILVNQPASQPVEDTNTVQVDVNSDNQLPTPTSNTNTIQSNGTPTSETPVNKPGWITTTNQQLGIRFDHPADASVSSIEQRQTTDGTTINEVIVTPKGMDPTRVHFFSTNASLDQSKNVQIYEFTKIKSSEFTNATIDGRAATRRIDHYLYNDCTNELTVVEESGVVYGSHVVQCPTHSEDYDQLRRDIANSFKLP